MLRRDTNLGFFRTGESELLSQMKLDFLRREKQATKKEAVEKFEYQLYPEKEEFPKELEVIWDNIQEPYGFIDKAYSAGFGVETIKSFLREKGHSFSTDEIYDVIESGIPKGASRKEAEKEAIISEVEDVWSNFMDQFMSPSEVTNEDIINEWNRIKKEFNLTDEEVFKALSNVIEDPLEWLEGTGLEERIKTSKKAKLSPKDKEYYEKIYPENYGDELVKRAKRKTKFSYRFAIKREALFGRPKTDEERLETHKRLYPEDKVETIEDLPPRGFGRGRGRPLTDEERLERHKRLYPEKKVETIEDLPPRGTGLRKRLLERLRKKKVKKVEQEKSAELTDENFPKDPKYIPFSRKLAALLFEPVLPGKYYRKKYGSNKGTIWVVIEENGKKYLAKKDKKDWNIKES